jgi:hypothetical protein
MKTRSLLHLILCVSPWFLGGCATRALWQDSTLDAWNEPADQADLRLYDAPRRKDVLVVYQEYSERNDSVHRRTYWLERNRKKIEQKQPPDFVGPQSTRGLAPIPVFAATNAPEAEANWPPLYAVVQTNQHSFIVYSTGQPGQPQRLPVYNDGIGKTKRIALTPLCVVADITIVGGFIVCEMSAGAARSGTVFYSH